MMWSVHVGGREKRISWFTLSRRRKRNFAKIAKVMTVKSVLLREILQNVRKLVIIFLENGKERDEKDKLALG